MRTDFVTIDATSDIESVTYNYSKGGELLRRQLARRVLSDTGIWADVAFLHQDRDMNTDGWKPAKITVVRFKRVDGCWKKQNHLNVNSVARVDQIIHVLSAWRDKVDSDV